MIKPRTTINVGEVGRHYDELDTFYREIWGDHVHHGLWTTGRETVDDAIIGLIDAVADAADIKSGLANSGYRVRRWRRDCRTGKVCA